VVAADGTLARGKDVASSSKTGNGTYQVTFSQNVSACAYVAQVGSTDSSPPPVGVSASTAQVSSAPDAVAVTTFNGSPMNVPFDLSVLC